jgi:hypothetical protein
MCGAACIDTSHDPKNCDGCKTRCGSAICTASACEDATVLAFTKLYLGDTDLAGVQRSTASKEFGENIDGIDTSGGGDAGASVVCKPSSGGAVARDGTGGHRQFLRPEHHSTHHQHRGLRLLRRSISCSRRPVFRISCASKSWEPAATPRTSRPRSSVEDRPSRRSLCSPSTFDGIAQQLRQSSDIFVDGTQGPNKICDGISIGLGFEAKSVMLGDVLPKAAPPVNVCD